MSDVLIVVLSVLAVALIGALATPLLLALLVGDAVKQIEASLAVQSKPPKDTP